VIPPEAIDIKKKFLGGGAGGMVYAAKLNMAKVTKQTRRLSQIVSRSEPAVIKVAFKKMVIQNTSGRRATTNSGSAGLSQKAGDSAFDSDDDENEEEIKKQSSRLLQQEARMMWLLNSAEHCVRLLGVCVDPQPGLVFEYCNEGTLQGKLWVQQSVKEQDGSSKNVITSVEPGLSRAQQITCVYHLLNGLQSLHSRPRPIIHRDIKSANILVHNETQDDEKHPDPALVFKIADFGSARMQFVSSAQSKSGSQSIVASTGGTLRWKVPELLGIDSKPEAEQRKLKNNPAVDIYSLGLVFAEVFLRVPPYANITSDLGELEAAIRLHKPPFDWSKLKTISPKLCAMLQGCCDPKPGNRSSLV